MGPAPLRPHRMGHLALRVSDLSVSEKFYTEILGMRLLWRREGEIAFVECGNDDLALIQVPEDEADDFQHCPPTVQSLHHFGFRVRAKEEIDRLAQEVRDHDIVIDEEPRDHRDGSRSFYFKDPDGNYIQVLWDPIRETPSASCRTNT